MWADRLVEVVVKPRGLEIRIKASLMMIRNKGASYEEIRELLMRLKKIFLKPRELLLRRARKIS